MKEKKHPKVNKAKKFESSISNGRKIFRLLLWMNEMAEINELMKEKVRTPMWVLKMISLICSFIYYLTDNIVYLASLDFVSHLVPGTSTKWKQIKNRFSLTKTVLEVAIAIYQIVLKRRKEEQITKSLQPYSNLFVQWSS